MIPEDHLATYLETGRWDPAWGPMPARLPALRDALVSRAPWAASPPDGLDRMLAALRRQAGMPTSVAPDAAPTADTTTTTTARHVPTRRRLAVRGIALAAALAVTVAVLVVGWPARVPPGPDAHDFALAGSPSLPGASASGRVWSAGSGEWFELHLDGLPPAGDDTYYAGWVGGDEGRVSIGTFHARDTTEPVHLWAGVPVERFPVVTVTRQRVGDPPGSVGEVVLRGRIPASAGSSSSSYDD